MAERGRVALVAGKRCAVTRDSGEAVDALARGRLFARGEQPLVVGDRVELSREGEQWMIESAEARSNEFVRKGLRSERQVLFANVDRVLIIAALAHPPTKTATMDRFLVAALRGGVPPLLVLTKRDLAEDGVREREVRDAYDAFDLPIFSVSNETGAGCEVLRAEIAHGVTALAGNSGVGKSSLVNRLVPGSDLRTREISAWSGKGTHMTSAALLVPFGAPLPTPPASGAAADSSFLIDTPGMKSFTPWGIDRASLIELFPDLHEHAVNCRFTNCGHAGEPGCAIQIAVESGALAASRLKSYVRIIGELS
ncbi:ribosome small subunit-dependent GTPase A [candidate division KSB1 bacterium]|nr:ribosome small subunit-dependent GTPase A [candidate division KSB1 bacterium]